MFKKKNKKFNNSEVEAQKAEMRRREDIQMKYKIARCNFEKECIELGVEEVPVLNTDESSIVATVTLKPFKPDEKAHRLKFIESTLHDLEVMAGIREPEQEEKSEGDGVMPSSGLVDANGNPIEGEKPQVEAEKAEDSAKEEEEEVESEQEPS